MSLFTLGVLQAVLWVAGLAAIGVVATNWPAALDFRITLRYLRSRRSSRLLSLITVIAVGGVTVGVMALVVVLGVMNGLQADLRDKILVANPHLRVLTYGEGLRLDDWHKVLGEVRRTAGVQAAVPFVLTQGLISAGHDYAEGVIVYGVDPDTGSRAVTSFARRKRASPVPSRKWRAATSAAGLDFISWMRPFHGSSSKRPPSGNAVI